MANSPIRHQMGPLSNQARGRLTPSHSTVPTLESAALFAGRNEIVITHGDETYRLRLTRQNRLILTK